MEWWQALILGIVEGLTEYLPISSTGHLLLAERALRISQTDAADAFAICIQAGAILAVAGIFWRRLLEILRGLAGKNPAGLQLGLCLLIAFLPAAVVGVLFSKVIKAHLFGLWPVVTAWLVGGVAILLFFRKPHVTGRLGLKLEQVTWKAALIVGLIQCIAMWPGVSRSLVTIAGGLLVGWSLLAALEFSFLLGLITLSAATVKDAAQHGNQMLAAYGGFNLALGFIAALVSAAIAVRWMLGYLQIHGMGIFGWYRIALALTVGTLLLSGLLQP